MLLPDHILNKMSEEDRKALGKAGVTATEAQAKESLRLEREDHRQFSQWLNSREIYYLWSRTDKAVTIQVGHPDFTLFHRGLTLFVEFKLIGKKLSLEQDKTREHLTREHFDYFLVYSAEEAIKGCKRFFSL
jgi:hypothetical protein